MQKKLKKVRKQPVQNQKHLVTNPKQKKLAKTYKEALEGESCHNIHIDQAKKISKLECYQIQEAISRIGTC